MDNENQQAPIIPEQKPAKNSNNLSFLKTLSYGFVIVSIGIIIAVGGYLLGANKSKSQPATKILTPTPLSTEASAKAGDPTANWKTFVDAQKGLSIKYPRDWKFDEQGDKNILLVDFCGPKYWEKAGNCRMAGKGSTAAITLRNDSLDIDRAGFCSQNPMNMFCGKILSRKEITIGGMNGKIFEMEINGGSLVALWKGSPADERMYELSADDLVSFPENKAIFNQILSTFKFTDQNQVDSTANWKTYSSTQYGFEIKYPENFYVFNVDSGSTKFYANHRRFSVGFRDSKLKNNPAAGSALYVSIYETFNGELRNWMNDNSTPFEFGSNEYTQSRKLYYNSSNANPKDTNINGIKALSFDLIGGYPTDETIVLLKNGSDLFEILYQKNGGQVNIFDQILSTFRFLN